MKIPADTHFQRLRARVRLLTGNRDEKAAVWPILNPGEDGGDFGMENTRISLDRKTGLDLAEKLGRQKPALVFFSGAGPDEMARHFRRRRNPARGRSMHCFNHAARCLERHVRPANRLSLHEHILRFIRPGLCRRSAPRKNPDRASSPGPRGGAGLRRIIRANERCADWRRNGPRLSVASRKGRANAW